MVGRRTAVYVYRTISSEVHSGGFEILDTCVMQCILKLEDMAPRSDHVPCRPPSQAENGPCSLQHGPCGRRAALRCRLVASEEGRAAFPTPYQCTIAGLIMIREDPITIRREAPVA